MFVNIFDFDLRRREGGVKSDRFNPAQPIYLGASRVSQPTPSRRDRGLAVGSRGQRSNPPPHPSSRSHGTGPLGDPAGRRVEGQPQLGFRIHLRVGPLADLRSADRRQALNRVLSIKAMTGPPDCLDFRVNVGVLRACQCGMFF